MRATILTTVSAALLAASALGSAYDCTYSNPPDVYAGRDSQGYFVRTGSRPDSMDHTNWSIQGVGDDLASRAGATVLYCSRHTYRDVSRGEWRGPDPLSAFRAFCAAGGLEVENPSPNLWVVGSPEVTELSATTVFVRPLDPVHQGFQSAQQIGDVERALLDQLPVRDACPRLQRCSIGVGYYWLPEEGRDVMLVLPSDASQAMGRYDMSLIFKVRIGRTGAKPHIQCIWAERAHGLLVPEIAEDFDGDGVRDFVFWGGFTDYTPNEIISGKDGHVLLRFVGADLLVEKAVTGPTRIGVWGEFSYSRTREPEPVVVPRVFELVPANQEEQRAPGFRPIGRVVKAQVTQPDADAWRHERDTLRQEFAAVVGGTDKVKAYVIGSPSQRTTVSAEEVRVPGPQPVSVTRETIEKGLPARILFEYKSKSWLEEEKRRREQAVKP